MYLRSPFAFLFNLYYNLTPHGLSPFSFLLSHFPMLPEAFLQQMSALLGAEEAQRFCKVLTESEPPTSVRLNRRKLMTGNSDLLSDIQDTAVAWCDTGVYLKERPMFTLDPVLHAGGYYVQEAASMFIEQAYCKISADFTPERLLDLCAAPGGKSTLWRSLLPDGALLVANEPMRQRAEVLAENLTKWGHPDVIVTNAFPNEFSDCCGMFDVIATDVPCSGEGMFRKDEGAVTEWSPANVVTCADRQWSILCDIWSCLRTGGYLVYSTCTYNRLENEEMVARICKELGAEIVPLDVESDWNVLTLDAPENLSEASVLNNGMYHFFPHLTRGEGLFLCLMRKTADTPEPRAKKEKKAKGAKPQVPAGASTVAKWLADAGAYKILSTGEAELSAIRQSHADVAQRLMTTVKCLKVGVTLAEEKGKKFAPAHDLALALNRNTDAFPTCEIDLDTALSYLRREAITIDAPKGYVIVTFKHLPLGFVNNLGNRANNMYPQQWRIRMK